MNCLNNSKIHNNKILWYMLKRNEWKPVQAVLFIERDSERVCVCSILLYNRLCFFILCFLVLASSFFFKHFWQIVQNWIFKWYLLDNCVLETKYKYSIDERGVVLLEGYSWSGTCWICGKGETIRSVLILFYQFHIAKEVFDSSCHWSTISS